MDDFNRLRFAELELRLSVDAQGLITGALVFAESAGAEHLAMVINGHVVEGSSPARFSFTDQGRVGTRSPTATTSTTA